MGVQNIDGITICSIVTAMQVAGLDCVSITGITAEGDKKVSVLIALGDQGYAAVADGEEIFRQRGQAAKRARLAAEERQREEMERLREDGDAMRGSMGARIDGGMSGPRTPGC